MLWLIIGVSVVVIAALLAGGAYLWWWVPKWQMRSVRVPDPKDRADIEDNFRKTVSQVLTGLLVLFGVGFGAGIAYWGTFQTLQANQRAAGDLLINNQVSKGFELLGNKDNQIQQRLGGIYALEYVMNNSEQYQQPVLEGLSEFVRERTKNVTGDDPPATDIQAALTVIGRRKVIGTGRPDLSGAHIPQAHLNNANLHGTYLYNADLHKSELNCADLRSAHLNGAILNNAVLMGANLDGASLVGVSLLGGSLSNAQLNGANLIGAQLGGTSLLGTNLSGANLTGTRIPQAQLDEACGTNVTLNYGRTVTLKPCANQSHTAMCPVPAQF